MGVGSYEVCRLTGASYRQLDYWARTGHLGAKVDWHAGSGSVRNFSERDVEVVRALVALSAISNPANLRAVAEMVSEHVREHGLTGKVQLTPYITVDVGKLAKVAVLDG